MNHVPLQAAKNNLRNSPPSCPRVPWSTVIDSFDLGSPLMCRHISPMRIYPKLKSKQCKIHSTCAYNICSHSMTMHHGNKKTDVMIWLGLGQTGTRSTNVETWLENDICLGNIRNHLAQDYILYKLFTGNQLSNEYIEPTVAAVLFIME